MRLAVWNEGIWKPSKYTNGDCRRISFKSLNKDDKKTYYLNQDTSHDGYENWLPHIIKGTVLDVDVMPIKDGNIINKFKAFSVIKKVKVKE